MCTPDVSVLDAAWKLQSAAELLLSQPSGSGPPEAPRSLQFTLLETLLKEAKGVGARRRTPPWSRVTSGQLVFTSSPEEPNVFLATEETDGTNELNLS